jgi:Tol biopolymer transport system component
MDIDGANQKQLTFDENSKNKIDLYNRGQISWTKEGDYILFLFNGDIWQVDISGNNPFSLTSTNDVTMFKFCPDKTKILYSREKTKYHNGLWIMLADGTNQLQIEKSLIKYPAFDWVTNDRIIFFNNSAIYSAMFNGTDRKIILQTKYPFNEISWSKSESVDGYVAFISDEKENQYICISDSTGKNLKQITENSGFNPVWYKDGITLFFIEKNDLYKFNINTLEKKRLTYHFQSYYPLIAEVKTKKVKQGK